MGVLSQFGVGGDSLHKDLIFRSDSGKPSDFSQGLAQAFRLLRIYTVERIAGIHLFLIAQEGTVDAMLRRWVNQRVLTRGPALRSLHARTARCRQDQEYEHQAAYPGLARAEAQTWRNHF